MNTYGIEKHGIICPTAVFRNLTPARLVEDALKKGEGMLNNTGALCITTGKYTGRSPNDKFIVDTESVHDKIAWGKVNVPITKEKFDRIYTKITAYLQNRDIYIFDGFAGADKRHALSFRIINEMPSQNLFIQQLLIRPDDEQLENFREDYTVIVAPGLKCDPATDGVNSEAAIMIDYERQLVLIAGSGYAGEIKKSVFSVMNYVLPQANVLPMHCSANIGKNNDTALFFGLSGTGKTTLSADPQRMLIGDDEHGWSDEGIFNFEGGCYAKCINLSKENEPQIWDAIKFGTLIENVVIDEKTRVLDYSDDSITENTRAGYPVDFIPNAVIPGVGTTPNAVVFLTADAFGVLPPISKLEKNAAMYHFVSGYTSKLAGTERGITEPQATFSTCFGEPFLPLDPNVYAQMLGERIEKSGASVYLINTGWSGGAYGTGKRMSLKYTRAMVTAALDGLLDSVKYVKDPIFNVLVPTECPNVPSEILMPENTWEDKAAYADTAKKLAGMFTKNFEKYKSMPKEIIEAGPLGSSK
jgi:phosphoenolpyruvate carboxykinase (ATP)